MMWESYVTLWITPSCEMTAWMSFLLYSPLFTAGAIGFIGIIWWDRFRHVGTPLFPYHRPTLQDVELLHDILQYGIGRLTESDQTFLVMLQRLPYWELRQCERFDRLLTELDKRS